MFLYLFAFKKWKSWVKRLFLQSGIPEVAAGSGEKEWVCAWEVTALWPLKNLGTAANKVPSVHTAAGTPWGCAVSLDLLFLGKDGFQAQFLPLGVEQGQVTWGSEVLQACLRLRFVPGSVCGGPQRYSHPWGLQGQCWSSLASPVLWQSRGHTGDSCCLPAHLFRELLGFSCPRITRWIFSCRY